MDDARLNDAAPSGAEIHTLTGSSTPGVDAPAFASVAAASPLASQSIFMTTEQRLLDLNGQYDRAIDFWDAEADAGILTRGHGGRILNEIAAAAYAIPSQSLRDIALKARIVSWNLMSLWDPTVRLDDTDAPLKMLIDDVLALGGVDRIRGREEPFEELLPSFKPVQAARLHQVREPDAVEDPDARLIAFSGKVRALALKDEELTNALCDLEAMCEKAEPEAPPSRRQEAIDAYLAELAKLEAAVVVHTDETGSASIRGAKKVRDEIEALGAAEHEEWRKTVASIKQILGLPEMDAQVKAVFEELKEAARKLTFMPPTTLAGLAAKAEASLVISRTVMDSWADDLSEMIVREAVMIGRCSGEPVGQAGQEAAAMRSAA